MHAYRLLVSGVRAFCGSEWSEAVTACEAAERAFRDGCTGAAWEIWTMQCFGNFAFSYLGRWRDLGRRVDASLADARERGSAYGMIATCLPLGITAWLARGEVEATRRFCSEAMASWSVEGFHLQHYWFLMAECHLDLYQGDGVAAWQRVRTAWPSLVRSLLLRMPLVRVQMLHVRAAGALAAAAQEPVPSSRQTLLAEAAAATRKIEGVSLPFATPLASLLRASHSAQLGDTPAALAHLNHSIVRLDHLGMAGYAAAARCRRAQLMASPMPAVFMPGEEVADPASMLRMLAPGFPV